MRGWGPRVTGTREAHTLPAAVRRLGLLSDAHGQRDALEHAVRHLKELGAQAFLFNGDALDYWGRCVDAAGTLQVLRDIGAVCIEGNHDAWNADERATVDAELSAWHAEWPFARRIEADGTAIAQFHGGLADIIQYSYAHAYTREEFGEMLKAQECQYLIFGHTHTAMCIETDHGLVINPGALAYVSTHDGRPSYALLDLDRQTCAHYEVYPADAPLRPLRRQYGGW